MLQTSLTIEQQLAQLPDQPGVYKFYDAKAALLYVGKAKSLRNRVRSYFQDYRPPYEKRDLMLEAACDFETIVVDNEKEAIALENNLIKQFKPRYNILLRDDKSYPYIKLTAGERFNHKFDIVTAARTIQWISEPQRGRLRHGDDEFQMIGPQDGHCPNLIRVVGAN